ncbi:MAG: hypothetical protein WA364_27965 [Candidatus Nitrosopolaris sp.]
MSGDTRSYKRGRDFRGVKANMIDAITLAIKSIDRKSQGRRMVIEVPTT